MNFCLSFLILTNCNLDNDLSHLFLFCLFSKKKTAQLLFKNVFWFLFCILYSKILIHYICSLAFLLVCTLLYIT